MVSRVSRSRRCSAHDPEPWKDDAMMSLATLALGLAFFGLFYALVVGCDHL
jgi:hypothetical protein